MLIRFLTRLQPFLESDSGADGGEPPPQKPTPSALLAQFNNDALRMAERLADVLIDNQKQRDELRGLRAQNRELKERAILDGMTALSAEDAALWEAYRALGEPPTIKRLLDEHTQATTEMAAMKRAETVRQAAEIAGFKPSVLAKVAGDLPIELRPVNGGKPLAVVIADGEEKALEDYAKDAWADFLPALRQQAQPAHAPDINAGARGNGNGAPLLTDDERKAASARYRATF